MLEIDDLHFSYGSIAALRGVSLRIDEGEIVGVIGPNGAGKTTTLAAVTGQVRPARGRITLEGRDLRGLNPEKVVRLGMSLVPEGRDIFGSLSVGENLMLGATRSRDRRAAAQDCERMLERFPVLKTYFRSSAAKLSGGEQQQLAIARALMARPRLLLLDEPSLGLAPLVVDLVFQTIGELRSEGVTILLVEQNAARTIAFADRTYVLRTGNVAASGTSQALRSSADIAELYLGV
jgi:branched-chain amino acid transport system ATP-binding protein